MALRKAEEQALPAMDKRRNSMENRKILGKRRRRATSMAREYSHLKVVNTIAEAHIWMTPRVQQSSKPIQEGSLWHFL